MTSVPSFYVAAVRCLERRSPFTRLCWLTNAGIAARRTLFYGTDIRNSRRNGYPITLHYAKSVGSDLIPLTNPCPFSLHAL
jgi:hypothetical protein